MNEHLKMVLEFHSKFRVPILSNPSLIPSDRSDLRYKLIADEVEEYKEGIANEDLPNIAKELADILYGVYGTILEHGLQEVIEDVFTEVHRSNMSKSYSQGKMIKGSEYREAELDQFFP